MNSNFLSTLNNSLILLIELFNTCLFRRKCSKAISEKYAGCTYIEHRGHRKLCPLNFLCFCKSENYIFLIICNTYISAIIQYSVFKENCNKKLFKRIIFLLSFHLLQHHLYTCLHTLDVVYYVQFEL